MSEISSRCVDCWQELIHAYSEIERLRAELIGCCGQKGIFDLATQALSEQSQWKIALELRLYLDVKQQQILFPRLLEIACSRHLLTRQFADAVCAYPLDWLLKNIELAAEPFLTSEEAYWQLFAIYARLERGLASRLLAKASSSPDPDVRSFAAEHTRTAP